MGTVRTLHFRFDQAEGEKWAETRLKPIGPGERACFGNMPDIALTLKSGVALAMVNGALRQLPIRELHVGDPAFETEGSPLYRKVSVVDGDLADTVVAAGQQYTVIVENDSEVAVLPKVVLQGVSAEGGLGEIFTTSGERRPVLSMTRRFVLSHGGGILQQNWPCAGLVHRITMRSDSEMDVDVSDLRISNVSLTVGGVHPIEFYREGWAVTPFRVERYNRMSVSLNGPAERWVEVDVDFEPLEIGEGSEVGEQ